MPTPPTVMNLDDFEAVPGPGTLSWLPVRHTLGIRAFGCNAYVAQKAGDDVVEPHDEQAGPGQDPAGAHQEVYFVARGHALFTIDGQTHDAREGTYVFIPDPSSHRHATALEAGTTVLSFGGPPTFDPSSWEWAFRAAGLMREDRAQAREVLEEGLRLHPDDAGLIYNFACLAAREGDPDQTLEHLARAFELRPATREWARGDADLDALRDDPRFTRLLADAEPDAEPEPDA